MKKADIMSAFMEHVVEQWGQMLFTVMITCVRFPCAIRENNIETEL